MLSSPRLLLTLAFLEGATVMAVELLSARMLTPYFGAGVHVWGAVIGITVASLAVGYYLGGHLCEKGIDRQKLFFMFLISSAFMMLMPMEAKSLIATFSESAPLPSVVFIATLLLVPCLGLLGATPVMIIHLLSESTQDSGQTAGNVYAISTIGGIFSTMLVGFYIIPEFGITSPTVILALIPGALSLILLLMSGKIIALAFLVVLLFGGLSTRTRTPRSNVKVHYSSEGLLGQVMVADAVLPGLSNRILFVNRMGQTFVNLNTGESRWSYVNYITSLCSSYPEKTRALLLGLGGGSIARNLTEILGFELVTVELDERMGLLGKQYFGLQSDINPIIDDARHYLESTEDIFDIIVIDLFKGEVPPAHVLSKECFETVKSRLTENGLLLINFNGFLEGEAGRAGRSLYNTLLAADLNVKILPTYEPPKYRNCIYVCPKSEESTAELRYPMMQNGGKFDFASAYLQENAVQFPDAPVFYDDRPLLEHFNVASARIWREEYKKSYTDMFVTKGIELFK
ncbi:MAG TPA: hypothetical protein EYN41_08715 [Flavobacteriales bacterium]|nr:hypothetical protein [Flavobacteriales bacterium]